MQQPANNIHFNLYYCYYLEVMTATLNRRMDKLICFLQFVLGSAVFADTQHSWLFGLVMAAISGFQFIYSPAAVAANAKSQSVKYRSLIRLISTSDDHVIATKIAEIEESDSDALSCLFNPARLRASIATNCKRHTLTKFERFAAWCAGGIPQ